MAILFFYTLYFVERKASYRVGVTPSKMSCIAGCAIQRTFWGLHISFHFFCLQNRFFFKSKFIQPTTHPTHPHHVCLAKYGEYVNPPRGQWVDRLDVKNPLGKIGKEEYGLEGNRPLRGSICVGTQPGPKSGWVGPSPGVGK